MEILNVALTIIYVFCCLFLGFVVLIQKGEGGGLGGLAGGGAAVDKAFGAKADMTWKRATAVAATLFMCLTIVLGVLGTQLHKGNSIAAEAMRKAEQQKNANAKDPGGASDAIKQPGVKTGGAEAPPAKTQ